MEHFVGLYTQKQIVYIFAVLNGIYLPLPTILAELHSIMMIAFHVKECAGKKYNNEGHRCDSDCLFLLCEIMRLSHYEAPMAHCAVTIVGYLCLNDESLQTIPMNFLVRIGLRLTHLFV